MDMIKHTVLNSARIAPRTETDEIPSRNYVADFNQFQTVRLQNMKSPSQLMKIPPISELQTPKNIN
jgi:hypothetical protein